MAGKEILVVAGDRGGWNALELPISRALDAGCNVRVYFVATCGEQFANGKLLPDVRIKRVVKGTSDPVEMAKFFGRSRHDLTVVGASQSEEGAQAAWHALVLGQTTPRLGLQDMYGSSMPTLRLASNALDCLCVTDEFSRNLVLREFPELCNHIVVTGGPQFDKTIEVKNDWAEKRRQLREAMQVSDEQIVFLVAGGLNGTAEMLKLLWDGIEFAGLEQRAKVVIRVHPRAIEKYEQLVEHMSVAELKRFTDVDRKLAPFSEDLLPSVDFVLSGYSTTNYYGILYGMLGVVYVGTPAFKKDLKKEKGLDRPPEVDVGAGWYVQTGADMGKVIIAVRHGVRVAPLLKVMEAQSTIASYNDGHATDRVWEEMQKLMAG